MENIKNKLKVLLQCEYGEMTIRQKGRDYVVESQMPWALYCRLTLRNGAGLPEDREIWRLDPYELKGEEGAHILTGEVSSPDWEDEQEVELHFTAVDSEMGNLALELALGYQRPWIALGAAGMELLRKQKAAPELLNDRERALLPLLRELGMLCGCCGSEENVRFSLLREKFGMELHPYLDRIEKATTSWKKYQKEQERLMKRLNRIEYRPLWQSIRDEIAASQEAYPRSCGVSEALIRQIEEGLYRQGYSGCYPNFVKSGTIEQGRTLKAYENHHRVRRGTRAVFHIRVVEQAFESLLFLCGTELLREGEQSLGFESCAFDAKGQRFLRTVQWFDTDDLDRAINIAAKKAELRKLNREERTTGGTLWPLFAVAFILGGGFFAICMTLGMAVVAALTALLAGGADVVWTTLTALPWMELFLFCFVTVGGTLGALLLLNLEDE